MKIRKGQSVLKLKIKIDQVHKVVLWDKENSCGWALMYKLAKEIPLYKKRIERPNSFCLVNDKIHLNSKSDKAWEVKILGSVLVEQ